MFCVDFYQPKEDFKLFCRKNGAIFYILYFFTFSCKSAPNQLSKLLISFLYFEAKSSKNRNNPVGMAPIPCPFTRAGRAVGGHYAGQEQLVNNQKQFKYSRLFSKELFHNLACEIRFTLVSWSVLTHYIFHTLRTSRNLPNALVLILTLLRQISCFCVTFSQLPMGSQYCSTMLGSKFQQLYFVNET